jgi:hypothetical protein
MVDYGYVNQNQVQFINSTNMTNISCMSLNKILGYIEEF